MLTLLRSATMPPPKGSRQPRTRAADRLRFAAQFEEFRRLSERSAPRFDVDWKDCFPCLTDATRGTAFDRHYVYHTAWAARIVARQQPRIHRDFSGLLYFAAMISAFVEVELYEYQPAELRLPGLRHAAADLTRLPFADDSLESISCMHVVEHLGLGRYGDPLNPDADLAAIRELKRVLAPGGSLLFVAPIGRPRLVFNAHRIYSVDQITEAFGGLRMEEFALVPDEAEDGGLVINPPTALLDRQRYACGCFCFTKERT